MILSNVFKLRVGDDEETVFFDIVAEVSDEDYEVFSIDVLSADSSKPSSELVDMISDRQYRRIKSKFFDMFYEGE